MEMIKLSWNVKAEQNPPILYSQGSGHLTPLFDLHM